MPQRRRAAVVLAALALPLTSAAPAHAAGRQVVAGPGAAEAVAAAHGHVLQELPAVGAVVAELPAGADTALRAAGLAVAPADARLRVAGKPERDAATSPAPADDNRDVQLTAADPPAGDGAGVAVAVVDTGVARVEALKGVRRSPDFSDDTPRDGVDRYGHGTFVAGLVHASAPASRVISVKVAGADGSTSLVSVLEGIGWTIEHQDDQRIGVLNLSLGAPADVPYVADPLALAVESAWASGLVVVVAAGNDGPAVTAPGDDPYVVTVGASDPHRTSSTADDTVPSWSGHQALSPSAKPDVVAPGVDIVSVRAPGSAIDTAYPAARQGSDRFRGSGTSMATAITSGIAARLVAAHPEATPDDVKAALVASASRTSDGAPALDGAAADARLAAGGHATDQAWPTAFGLLDGGDHLPWGVFDPSGTRWTGTRWTGTRWSGSRWSGTRWSGTRWSGSRWSEVDWSGTRWSGSRWSGSRWSEASWSGTGWG